MHPSENVKKEQPIPAQSQWLGENSNSNQNFAHAGKDKHCDPIGDSLTLHRQILDRTQMRNYMLNLKLRA